MKENVFRYFFPGCISFHNMLPFEAQGCRFIFDVVFNHPLALKCLLCLESGLQKVYRACSSYLHTMHGPGVLFFAFLNCNVCHKRLSLEGIWIPGHTEDQSETSQADSNKWIFRTGDTESPSPFFCPIVHPSVCCGLFNVFPSIITCIKHSHTHPPPPLATSSHLNPFSKVLPSWTPRSDSQRGPVQSIREVIHTLPHLSYLLYYHSGWPIPCGYPRRPGAQAGYPGFRQHWQCPPTAPPPPHH